MDIHTANISALQAFSVSLGASASNIANQLTPGYRSREVHLIEEPQGGVRAQVRNATDSGPDIPAASGREQSEVSMTRETMQIKTIARSYQANARAFQILEDTKGDILDLIG